MIGGPDGPPSLCSTVQRRMPSVGEWPACARGRHLLLRRGPWRSAGASSDVWFGGSGPDQSMDERSAELQLNSGHAKCDPNTDYLIRRVACCETRRHRSVHFSFHLSIDIINESKIYNRKISFIYLNTDNYNVNLLCIHIGILKFNTLVKHYI